MLLLGGTDQVKRYKAEFTAKNLTGNAGLLNLGKFAEKVGLKSMLEQHLTIKRRSNARYSPADAVMMLIKQFWQEQNTSATWACCGPMASFAPCSGGRSFPLIAALDVCSGSLGLRAATNYPRWSPWPGKRSGPKNGSAGSPSIWIPR